MGFVADYVRKIKDGIAVAHKSLRFGNVREEFSIRDDALLFVFKYCIGLYIDKLGGIYKMLYDLRKNNDGKKIYVMLPREERRSILQSIHYSVLPIGEGTSDEMAIHNIFSLNYDMVVDTMYEKEDGSLMRIYLKFPSCYVEADE